MNKFFSSFFSYLKKTLLLTIFCLLFTACENNQSIVSNIDEKEANEIVVYLASKGIVALKVQGPQSETATNAQPMYDIFVEGDRSVDAMSILNKAGLPRRMGTNLLELFAKSGLMSSEREETIRYQAGLAEELKNTIRKIDGVLDADVQLSFPSTEQAPGAPAQKITAAVYIKHQGILDDPNIHMESKIKRLLAGSVNGLTFENVTVISDRSRFTDVNLNIEGEPIGKTSLEQTYVSIWGVILTKGSLMRFRVIFFSFIILLLALCAGFGYAIFKFYPIIREELLRKQKEKTPEEPPAT